MHEDRIACTMRHPQTPVLMPEIIVTESEAWPGILAALAQARPADTVRLRPGRYEGAETLRIPSHVTLTADPGTTLAFTGTPPAILIQDAEHATLSNLTLTPETNPLPLGEGRVRVPTPAPTVPLQAPTTSPLSRGGDWARVPTPAPPPNAPLRAPTTSPVPQRRTWAISATLTSLKDPTTLPNPQQSQRSTLPTQLHPGTADLATSTSYAIPSHSTGQALIWIDRSQSIILTALQIEAPNGQPDTIDAIALHQSTLCTVSSCTIRAAGRDGIALLSSEATLTRNTVNGMRRNGITLSRSVLSLDQPSRASIEHNRCHDNIAVGILLSSSEATPLADNECWANRKSGIVLEPNSRSPNQLSRASIVRNRCYSNARAGINLFSSRAAVLANNHCWENYTHGISLERDPYSPGEPSRAPLEHNRCHDNAEAGIVLLSSEAPIIADNECWANKSSGITLQRDQNSPNQPSWANIRRNRSHHNVGAGILLFSSDATVIADNECWSNQQQGINLQCDPISPSQPSRASIQYNSCHANASAGIALFSSEAATIADNECWSNQKQGIALQRDSLNPGRLSRASIKRNRCHDNAHAGIALFSSEATIMADNDCRANQSGIALESDPRSPDHPSHAVIERNYCHDNAEAGIVLFSTEAAALVDNECWSNHKGGIILQRDFKNPNKPSRAQLLANLCDNNQGPGFLLLGAHITTFTANRIWNNLAPSLIPMPNDPDLNRPWTPPEPALATTLDFQAQARRRARSPAGLLAGQFESSNYSNPDAWADFIAGPGCPNCLVSAWRPASRRPAPNRTPDPPQKPRLYRLHPAPAQPDRLLFHRAGHAGPTDRVWTLPRRSARPAAPIRVIALLAPQTPAGPHPDPLAALDADLDRIRQADRGNETPLIAHSKTCHAAYAELDRRQQRVGRLLEADCAPRTPTVLAGVPPADSFLQREALGTGNIWRLRLRMLVRPLPLAVLVATPAVILLLAAALGRWKGFASDSTDIIGAARFFAIQALNGSQPWDWPGIAAFAALLPAFLLVLANNTLPRALRLQPPDWLRRAWLDRLLDPDDHKPALRWLRRRLYGNASQGLALLALRNPDLWPEDDLTRLKALLDARPAAQPLAVILPIRHPNQLVSALRPFLDPATLHPRPGLDIELLTLPEEPAETGPETPTKPQSPPDLLPLLGIPAQDRPTTSRPDLQRDLRDDRLTLNDLIPLLVFASTPGSLFILAYDRLDTDPSLNQVLQPYADFLADTPGAKPIPLDAEQAVARIRTSPAAFLHVSPDATPGGTRTLRRLVSRATHRDEFEAALRPIFPSPSAFDAYVSKLAGCGQLFNLHQAAALLAHPMPPDAPPRILRHLRAAAALARPVPPTSHRHTLLLDAWTTLADRLLATTAPLPPSQSVELAGLLCLAAAPDPDRGWHRLAPMLDPPGQTISDPTLPAPAPDATLQHRVTAELHRTLAALAELRPTYADRLLARLLAGPWQSLAPQAAKSLATRLAALRAPLPRLADRLALSPTYEAFDRLLQAHAADLPGFMTECYCTAARLADTLDAQHRLAAILLAHRAEGLTPDKDAKPDPPAAPGPLLDHLADPSTAQTIRAATADATPLDGDELYLGALDPMNAELDRIIEIVLSPKALSLGERVG